MQRSIRLAGLLAVLCALPLSGCGSGGGGGPVSACGLDTFTPNYAHNVAHLLTWPTFPVTVYFPHDANYTVALHDEALVGFAAWTNATGSSISLQETTSAAADITVRFDPNRSGGVTALTWVGLTMESAAMTVGTSGTPVPDQEAIAAHEFGHALGIDGHSDDPADLMYPVHHIGAPWQVTTRDLNTIKTDYCGLFSRAPRIRRPLEGPRRTTVIE